MRNKLTLSICCAVILACFAGAQPAVAGGFNSDAVGTTGSDFLNLGVGARALGMGGAYTAVAEDASAIYWNPAGLVQINDISATFMQANYVADINYQFVSYAHRINNSSVLAASILKLDAGRIQQTDYEGTFAGDYFNPSDLAVSLAYSRAILDLSDKDYDVAIGISGKYIKSKIVDSATAYGGDFGLMMFYFTSIPYRIGFTIQNLGKGTKYDQEYDNLPLNIKMGGSISPFKNVLVATDINLPKSNSPYFTLGTEWTIEPAEKAKLALRAGFNTQQSKIKDGLSGLSMGLGIGLQMFSLDYAYVPMGELGGVHRFSITFDFPYWMPVFQRQDRSVFGPINTPVKSVK